MIRAVELLSSINCRVRIADQNRAINVLWS